MSSASGAATGAATGDARAGALLLLCRVATGALFVFAAATKMSDMRQFAEVVANYQLLPARAVPSLSAALVGIELLCGALLLLGARARAAALVASALLVMFVAGLSQALSRGINLRCGCFGGADLATWWTVARDAALLLPSLAVALRGPGRLALDR